MMSNYFNFQREAISILWWSEVNERLLSVSFGEWGLFANKVLELSAIDLLASGIVWNIRSSVSNLFTSSYLFFLILASVVQSNVEWLAILVKDRPVVRDYKEMLDIETQLFDVAYFRSKQINLTRPIEWNVFNRFKALLEKYQDLWLLEKGETLSWNVAMIDILTDLVVMNAAMKHFIMIWGKLWKSGLNAYYRCMWYVDKDSCSRDIAVLKFSTWAIATLYEDYRDVQSFSACNSFANSFKSSIKRATSSASNSLKTAWEDIKNAVERLRKALVGKWAWNLKNNRQSMCDNISEYEMAQLRAYWWPDWTCGKFVKASASLNWTDVSSLLVKTKQLLKERKAQKEQKQKLKKSKSESEKNKVANELQSQNSTSEKRQRRYKYFWSGVEQYNPDFSEELSSKFELMFDDVMDKYWQSSENANSSEISDLLTRGKWILDQVDKSVDNIDNMTNGLKPILQKIVNKQCSG